MAATKLGAWFVITFGTRIDPFLLKVTRGRISTTMVKPTLLLHTVGARSGEPRTTPLVYVRDGGEIVLVASYGGNAKHPAWYHNLRAQPLCELSIAGRKQRYVARQVEGEERARLWKKANAMFDGFTVYQGRADAAGREIPIMVLTPTP